MRSVVVFLMLAACQSVPASTNLKRNSIIDDDKFSTHDILSSLGLQKLPLPASHHRKRLAEQGRRHASGDSRMFVIKLPPNQNYYAHSAPAPVAARTLPLPLTSNGKPAKVYHWNIPLLHKFASDSGRYKARFDDDIVNVEGTPTWKKGQASHPNSIDSMSYYVPTKPKKTSFRKYYSGNGKPKSFYVIQKDTKSTHYHKLLP